MEVQTRIINDIDTPKASGIADPKSKMAEYIVAQYGNGSTDVRSILNETKVGAWRKPTLQKMLNTVFSKP